MKIKLTRDVAGCDHLKKGNVIDVKDIPDALKFGYELVDEPELEVATPKKKSAK